MLALAAARGVPASAAIASASVPLRADGAARLIPGVPDAARAGALSLAWDHLVEARDALEADQVDVLVDAGRVPPLVPTPWVDRADLVLLVVRPTLPAVTAAHRWVATRRPTQAGAVPVGLVVVESPSPYRAHEVADAVGLPLHGVVSFDPARARVHAEGVPAGRGFARSAYARSIQRVAADTAARAGMARPAELVPPMDPEAA
jgi:hypothetical protein